MPNFYQNFPEDSSQLPAFPAVPDYLLAADNHNVGNTKGGSWFDPTTWEDKLSDGIEYTGKLAVTGLLSGANSFYNSGVAVGNLFGADAEFRDTKSWITSIDNDLGVYYGNNQDAADLVGLIAGSVIPGMVGVKALNAGQIALKSAVATGRIGGNLARATGLLTTETENFIAATASKIVDQQKIFSALSTEGLQALASGVKQNVLEGIAFETAVQATMFKSPILDSQDHWDIAKNILTGGLMQGAIAGPFSAAGTVGKLGKAVKVLEDKIRPFQSRELLQPTTGASEKILLLAEDRQRSIDLFQSTLKEDTMMSDADFRNISKAHTGKIQRIDNDIRTAFHELTGSADPELGNFIADLHLGTPMTDTADNYFALSKITGVKKDVADVDGATNTTSFAKLTGEGAGTITDTAPAVLTLADTVIGKTKESIESAVKAAVKNYDFKPSKLWSAADVRADTGHLEAQARYIWADHIAAPIKEGTVIHQYDFPLLQRALRDGQLDITVADSAGGKLLEGFATKQNFEEYLARAKTAVANDLLKKHVLEGAKDVEFGTQSISKITDTKLARLEGTLVNPKDFSDFHAHDSANAAYQADMVAKGLKPRAEDIRFLPENVKLKRAIPTSFVADDPVVDAMGFLKSRQKLYQGNLNNVVAKASGDLYDLIPTIKDSDAINAPLLKKVGQGFVNFADGNFGSLESIMQQSGKAAKLLEQKFLQKTDEIMSGPLNALMTNQEIAIEVETINQKVTRSGKQWYRGVHPDTGDNILISKQAKLAMQKAETEGSDFALSAEDFIKIKNADSARVIDAHMAVTSARVTTKNELNSALSGADAYDSDVYLPYRRNLKNSPYYSYVIDPTVTGQGHVTMIFASSDSALRDLTNSINRTSPHLEVRTRTQVSDHFKAEASHYYENEVTSHYLDHTLANKGTMSEAFTRTDPKVIANEILDQHYRQDQNMARQVVQAKNASVFAWLKDQSKILGDFESSKTGGISDRFELSGKNPATDYIRTGLNLSNAAEFPVWKAVNEFADSAVSKAWETITSAYPKLKTPEELDGIDKMLQKYGMQTGARDALADLYVNATAPRQVLSKFIARSNALFSRLMIGTDPLNAMNNAITANVLRNTELTSLIRNIKAENSELAGKLTDLAYIKLPDSAGDVLSTGKLQAQAIKDFFSPESKQLLARYEKEGIVKGQMAQFRSMIDDLSITGTESEQQLNGLLKGTLTKADGLLEKGEKYSGNKLAEDFNRFVSARSVEQLTDLAVASGKMTASEAKSYVNTFVNRVEGNLIASQRPLLFTGPVGQAIGLFQSYQFNLMQQLFRYAAEGTKKDTAMFMALQGTLTGLQGLPAFQYINQHVVGTLSGNTNHRDIYSSVQGAAGVEVGNLLLYGLPSNLLQANLYSRGDINPRQLTIVPTDLASIPIAGAATKVFSSVKETIGKISDGGAVWESMLQGIEHMGLSRPLAGFAQVAQGISSAATGGSGKVYSTDNSGSIVGSNDLLSWASLVRLAGGRPLDEAILQEATYRSQAYKQINKDKMSLLAEAIKTTAIGEDGETPEPEQVAAFAKTYAEAGGNSLQFNSFMMNQITRADTSRAEQIVRGLNNPYVQSLQLLMGKPLSQLSGSSQTTTQPNQ